MLHFNSISKRQFRKELVNLRPELYKIAWSWCHNTQKADDLVQETLEKALNHLSQLKDIEKIKPWLTRILANAHTDSLRKKKVQVPADEETLKHETNPDPGDLFLRDESIQLVRKAMSQLGDKHRKIISLVDIAEYSYLDVSESLDIPIGTVMSRLSRARKHLKEKLQALENPETNKNFTVGHLKRVK